ncbi:MAG: tetratricopeptide repeat protein, partial [Chloroflexi bacterium]|nr:tetratricopeptide repeat protein [Chloroflexota bacterium]
MAQYTQAYVVAQQTNLPWSLANSQHLLGRLHIVLGHYPTAEAHLRAAIAYGHQQRLHSIWLEASINLGEALRLQRRFDEAQRYYTESRQQAEALHDKFRRAQVLWAQGCMAEQRGAYAEAQAFFTESVTLGHPNLWVYLPPALGWALVGLGKIAEAQDYFSKVVTEPPTCYFLPVTLDAEVGLAYIAMLQASRTQPNAPEPVEVVFPRVYRHLAVTQETRTRIAKLAVALGVPLLDATPHPVGMVA